MRPGGLTRPGGTARLGAGFVYEDGRSMCLRAELGFTLYRGTRGAPVRIGNSCFVKVRIAGFFFCCLGCCGCHPAGLQLKFVLIPFCLIAVSRNARCSTIHLRNLSRSSKSQSFITVIFYLLSWFDSFLIKDTDF